MNTENICQSCSMPLTDKSLMGTEKDGSKNSDYCKYCYQNGGFVNPGITVNEMADFIQGKMKQMHIGEVATANAINVLPKLKRWQNK